MLQARLLSNLLNQGLRPYLTSATHTPASSSPGSKSSKSTFASRSNSNSNGNGNGININNNCNGSSGLAPEASAPLSISLLNGDGLPLSTVYNEEAVNSVHSNIDLKDQVHQMYPLVVRNALGQDTAKSWRKVKLTGNICAMITLLETSRPGGLFLIIIYHNKMPDLIVKIKLDELRSALNQGLKGY